MLRVRSMLLGLLLVLAAAAAANACSDNTSPAASPTPTVIVQSPPGGAAGSPAVSPTAAPAARTSVPSGAKRLGTPSGIAYTGSVPSFPALAGAKVSFGVNGNAFYAIEMPNKWNGDLVMWAHGFAGFGTDLEVDVPNTTLRQAWIDQGYAWAASSYSENGYVPGIGADDTLALKKLFEQQFKKAGKTYIVGESMGGNVVALALEKQADEYDGGLALCGAIGGEEQIDYLFSWTLVGEFIGGVPIPFLQGQSSTMTTALLGLSSKLGTPTQPTEKGRQFLSVIQQLTGGPRPFYLEGLAQQYVINFGFALADPERKLLALRAATNQDAKYQIEPGLGLTDQQVNDGVRRIAPEKDARNASDHPDAVPTTGKISDPLLTLHNTGDLFVPIVQEQTYRTKANAAGKGDLLVQRAIRDAGHCKFSAAEQLAAWNDLAAWVNTGKKPAGDDLSGDLSDIGKQFTNPLRAGDPGTK